jgi:hypothetical protein
MSGLEWWNEMIADGKKRGNEDAKEAFLSVSGSRYHA